MEDGYYYTGIRKLRGLYAQKLNAVLQAFAAYGGGIAAPLNTHSGINLTVKVRSKKESRQTLRGGKIHRPAADPAVGDHRPGNQRLELLLQPAAAWRDRWADCGADPALEILSGSDAA